METIIPYLRLGTARAHRSLKKTGRRDDLAALDSSRLRTADPRLTIDRRTQRKAARPYWRWAQEVDVSTRKTLMKDSLKPGIEHVLHFVVPEDKTVPALYPESPTFQEMPKVFATGFLVGLIEWACVEAINPHIDWPNEQTVGTRIEVSHCAATPPGLEVSAKVRLVEVDGRKLSFEVEARDSVDVISRGTHERFIIDAARFHTRVQEKARSSGV